MGLKYIARTRLIWAGSLPRSARQSRAKIAYPQHRTAQGGRAVNQCGQGIIKAGGNKTSADDTSEKARIDTAEIEAFMKRQSGFVSTSIEYFILYCQGRTISISPPAQDWPAFPFSHCVTRGRWAAAAIRASGQG